MRLNSSSSELDRKTYRYESLTKRSSGRLALSVGADRTLRLWDLVNARSAFITRTKGVPSPPRLSCVREARVLFERGAARARRGKSAATLIRDPLEREGRDELE